MKVLLLGASGLLGQNVFRQLLRDGYEVVALVRSAERFLKSIGHYDAQSYIAYDDERVFHFEDGMSCEYQSVYEDRTVLFTVRQGLLLSYEHLLSAASGCDAVINCAGTTDMSLLHYDDYLPVNVALCASLLRLMDDCAIGSLVHVSTANTIGYGSAAVPASECAPMQPPFADSFYARSKAEGERLLLDAAGLHPDRHIVILNPGFIIGAYDLKPSSGQLLLAAYRKPLMVVPKGGKSFVAASDAAVAVVNAVTLGSSGCRYLITGSNLSLREFYSLQASVCGYRQWLIPLPSWLALVAGRLGDLLRRCHIPTQLSSVNIRQLLVCEYYDSAAARRDLRLPSTPIAHAIKAFFAYRRDDDKMRLGTVNKVKS